METILVGTPIPHKLGSENLAFPDGVTIGKIQNIQLDKSFLNQVMSGMDVDAISNWKVWLTVSEDIESGHNAPPGYAKARWAMSSLQIIRPFGCKNVYMGFRKNQEGWTHLNYGFHPSEMKCPDIACMAYYDVEGIKKDFEKVYRGVSRAFDEKITRLENPIVLLELGLQANHIYLSTLMWVMALDMLFMAEKKIPFVERLTGFLGVDTLIFPPLFECEFQADLTVGSIATDLFQFRSIVAHGKLIPKKFLAQRELKNTNPECSVHGEDLYQYSYSQILSASALYLLVRSLRKIMVEDLIDVVGDDKKWRQKLKAGAARY